MIARVALVGFALQADSRPAVVLGADVERQIAGLATVAVAAFSIGVSPPAARAPRAATLPPRRRAA